MLMPNLAKAAFPIRYSKMQEHAKEPCKDPFMQIKPRKISQVASQASQLIEYWSNSSGSQEGRFPKGDHNHEAALKLLS